MGVLSNPLKCMGKKLFMILLIQCIHQKVFEELQQGHSGTKKLTADISPLCMINTTTLWSYYNENFPILGNNIA